MKQATTKTIFWAVLLSPLGWVSARLHGHGVGSNATKIPIDSEYHRRTQNRIVGGDAVTSSDYEFFALLGGCGGSLVHKDIVLSAAHCYNAVNGYARIGSNNRDFGGEILAVTSTKVRHPDYVARTVTNDFMIVKLGAFSSKTPVSFNAARSFPNDGGSVTAIGMGTLSESSNAVSSSLQEVTVEKFSDTKCDGIYFRYNTDAMICAGVDAGGFDSCQGDSGGPLLAYDGPEIVQVGVTSWGYGCAQAGYPGVYARVSHVADWIQEQICELSEDPPASCNGGTSTTPSTGGGGGSSPSTGGTNGSNDRSIRLRVNYDLYPEETGWVLQNVATQEEVDRRNFNTVSTTGVVDYRYDNLPPGEYYFLLGDDYEDGICCRWGLGNAALYEEFSDGSATELWTTNGRYGSHVETIVTLS